MFLERRRERRRDTQAIAPDWIHPAFDASALAPPASDPQACNGPWTYSYQESWINHACGDTTSPTALAFTPGPVTDLSPQFTPLASWVLDFNGDGRADLMVRSTSGVVVWLGIGGGQFESTGTTYGFRTTDGQPLANFSSYQLSHGDFNGDGLSDAVLTHGQTAVLFTNRGGMFIETPVAHLAGIPFRSRFRSSPTFRGVAMTPWCSSMTRAPTRST
jgi:hypothetical protein